MRIDSGFVVVSKAVAMWLLSVCEDRVVYGTVRGEYSGFVPFHPGEEQFAHLWKEKDWTFVVPREKASSVPALVRALLGVEEP